MGKAIVLFLLTLGLAACNDKKAASATETSLEMPEACAYEASGVFRSRQWGDLYADRYLCPVAGFEKMTCYFYKTPDGAYRELQCDNVSNLDPQVAPADCDDMYYEGITGAERLFFDGVRRTSDGFKCAHRYGLHCDYFEHRTYSFGGAIMTAADNLQCVQY